MGRPADRRRLGPGLRAAAGRLSRGLSGVAGAARGGRPAGGRERTAGRPREPLLTVLLPADDEGAGGTLQALLAQRGVRLEILVPAHLEPAVHDARLRRIGAAGAADFWEAARGEVRGTWVAVVAAGAQPHPEAFGNVIRDLAAADAAFGTALPSGDLRLARLHAVTPQLPTIDYLEASGDLRLWCKVLRRDLWAEAAARLSPAPPATVEDLCDRLLLAVYRTAPVIRLTGRPAGEEHGRAAQEPVDTLSRLLRRTQQITCSGTEDRVAAAWAASLPTHSWQAICRALTGQDTPYGNPAGQAARAMLQAVGRYLDLHVPLHERVLLYLCAEERREDILEVLADLQDHGAGMPLMPSAGAGGPAPAPPSGRPTYLPLLRGPLPDTLLRLGPADVRLHARLTGYAWNGPVLTVRGHAYLEGLGDDVGQPTLSAALVCTETGRQMPVPVSGRPDQDAAERSMDAWALRARPGFNVAIDAGMLLSAEAAGEHQWALVLTLRQAGFSRTARILERDGEVLAARLDVGAVVGQERVVGLFDRTRGLRLAVVRYRVLADAVDVRGSEVTLSLPTPGIRSVSLEGEGRSLALQPRAGPGESMRFGCILPPGAAGPAGTGAVLSFRAFDGQGGHHPVGWAGSSDSLHGMAHEPLKPSVNGFGFLQLDPARERAVVSTWRCAGDGTSPTLEGWSSVDPADGGLVLEGRSSSYPGVVTSHPDATGWRFEAHFNLAGRPWGGERVCAARGDYRLMMLTAGSAAVPVAAAPGLAGRLPEAAGPRLRIRIIDTGPAVVLKLLRPYPAQERGPRRRRLAVEAYRASEAPLQDAAFFESFAGKDGGDSLRPLAQALAEREPQWPRYWSVADFAVPAPAGTIPVLRYSAEWFHALATSRLLVSNDTLPPFFRKRQGQFYLQTWHGTPLKRVGSDTPAAGLSPSYRRILQREPQSWDLLLAQGTFGAETLASAFRYTGPVLARGYPRNDVLLSKRAPDVRRRTRELLGIGEDQTVVLYMPTWREGRPRSRGGPAEVLHTGFPAAGLEPGWVVLVRSHHLSAPMAGGPGVLDVTGFPDVGALCLAADILVTDYSSVMFDFCLTGKPMVFLVPDEEEYRTRVRGYYFDFRTEAPGPLLTDAAQLPAALAAAAAAVPAATPSYRRFRCRYAGSGSGDAASAALSYWKAQTRVPGGGSGA